MSERGGGEGEREQAAERAERAHEAWRQRLAHRRRVIPDSVRERLLRHPTRHEILELLRERPGLNKNQICRELDLNATLMDHHLSELERILLVVTRPSALPNETLCFPIERVDLWENERTRILFGRRPNRQVALYVTDHRGPTTREIADALGLCTSTVRYHLRTLEEHGLVHQYRAGRTFVYEADEELEAWVGDVGQGYERAWE